MAPNKGKAFINVTEKGKDFTMTDAEFHIADGIDRPILETNAQGTKIIGLRVFRRLRDSSKSKWFWYFLVPLLVGVILLLVEWAHKGA